MLIHHPAGYARAALLSAALSMSAPALANIVLPGGDNFLDGSFHGMTHNVSGTASLAARLYVGDLASTLPPFDQVVGTGLDFSYVAPVFGSHFATATYRLTNNDPTGPYSNLRFFLNLKTQGQANFMDTATVVGFGVPADPGAADQFQIFDYNAAGDKPLQQIEGNNNLNGSSAASCSTGCYSDLALQWSRAELLVGDTWEIRVSLVDDPKLVAGGRYLIASSLGKDGAQIIFGNPTPVPVPSALFLFASGLAGLQALRRRKA